MKVWQEQAISLFFFDHLNVGEISKIVGKARETVSRFLCEREGYDLEMSKRRADSEDRRREYQREWDREKRPFRFGEPAGMSLRREHDLAALILSHEKF